MNLVTTAIVPIVLILGLGAWLRHRYLREPGFWRGLEWMSYRIFTPALFITSIAGTDLTVVPLGSLLLSLTPPILLVTGLVLALRRPFRVNGPQLTSMVQGSIRINTYVGLIFAQALHGLEGVATFALASAVVVPLVNIISVSVLAAYGDKAASSPKVPVWRELIKNPLIQACALGLVLNLIALPLPGFISSAVTMLSAPALACGTLIAGAALHLTFHKRDIFDIGLATALKLVILPAAAASLAILLGATGATLTSIVLISAVPTAPSAYVLAAKMGGDTRLMASITGTQTILSISTLPVTLMIMNFLTGRA